MFKSYIKHRHFRHNTAGVSYTPKQLALPFDFEGEAAAEDDDEDEDDEDGDDEEE